MSDRTPPDAALVAAVAHATSAYREAVTRSLAGEPPSAAACHVVAEVAAGLQPATCMAAIVTESIYALGALAEHLARHHDGSQHTDEWARIATLLAASEEIGVAGDDETDQ